MIPFSPPRIDDLTCNEVVAALKSGWISTGSRTKLFEKKLAAYCNVPNVIGLNSATAGLELMLRWFGVSHGDEVILPAYTYSATANVIMHCGATPVFVDVNASDFNISISEIEKAISKKTKVIMPVDFAGLPCDYTEINNLVHTHKNIFEPNNEIQKQLGRILVLSDAAHSFGAKYKNKISGSLTDVSVFSFHAVKNLTTAEGGAIALNLPEPFNNLEIYNLLCIKSLHGQNKDALAKTQKGNWRYDIIEAGYKYNMTDIAAAIGLVELERYNNDTLIKRKQIVQYYNKMLQQNSKFILPLFETENKESSYHLYPLRIGGITEVQRDAIIQEIFNNEVSVNVHFIPVPAMSFYKGLGYDVTNYSVSLKNYECEISLPLYYNLTLQEVQTIVDAVIEATNKICA
jgi:dTDP-4-amino-4,6-dideoxygalactose transaminase